MIDFRRNQIITFLNKFSGYENSWISQIQVTTKLLIQDKLGYGLDFTRLRVGP